MFGTGKPQGACKPHKLRELQIRGGHFQKSKHATQVREATDTRRSLSEVKVPLVRRIVICALFEELRVSGNALEVRQLQQKDIGSGQLIAKVVKR